MSRHAWWSGLSGDALRACFTQAAQALPTRRIATAATNPNLTGIIIETDGGARVVSVS